MNEYKDNPTYRTAMRRLGILNAKKLLDSGSNAVAACPIPKATEEQKSEFILARNNVRALLHPEETPASSLHPGAVAERDRIEELDAIADLYDPHVVMAAKYSSSPITAQELATRTAQGMAFSSVTPDKVYSPTSSQSPVGQMQTAATVVPPSSP